MHLQPDELIDLAEGTRRESSAPHLADCEMCRKQLVDLRAMMTLASDVEVPEPSPLFWDHLSARVHSAVEGQPARTGWAALWFRFRAPIAIALTPAVLLLVVLSARVLGPHQPLTSSSTTAFVATPLPSSSFDDPSFALMTNLAGDFNLDAAREAGLTSAGSAEHAVTHMSAGELRELQRILQEELANSGD